MPHCVRGVPCIQSCWQSCFGSQYSCLLKAATYNRTTGTIPVGGQYRQKLRLSDACVAYRLRSDNRKGVSLWLPKASVAGNGARKPPGICLIVKHLQRQRQFACCKAWSQDGWTRESPRLSTGHRKRWAKTGGLFPASIAVVDR